MRITSKLICIHDLILVTLLLIIAISITLLPVLGSGISASFPSHGSIKYRTTEPSTIINEEFTTNSLANWTSVYGTWTIQDGKLLGEATQNTRCVIVLDLVMTGSYKLDVDVYSISGSIEPQTVIRFSDVNNYCFAGLGAYSYTGGIGSFKAGIATLLASGGGSNYQDLSPNVWHHLTVEDDQTTITLSIDGVIICQTSSSTHSLGQLGLTIHSGSAYFDNFEVQTQSAPTATNTPTEQTTNQPNIFMTGPCWCINPDAPSQSYLDDIKNHGFDVITLNVGWNKIEKTKGSYDSAGLAQVDLAVQRAVAADLYVVLRTHKWVLEGGAYQAQNPGNTGCMGFPAWIATNSFWSDNNGCFARYVEFVRMLADRYKNNDNVVGISLMSEPGNSEPNYWIDSVRTNFLNIMFEEPTKLWEQCINAIHSVKANMYVIFEGMFRFNPQDTSILLGQVFQHADGRMVTKPSGVNIIAAQSDYGGGFGAVDTYNLVKNNWGIPFQISEINAVPGEGATQSYLTQRLAWCNQNGVSWVHWNWWSASSTEKNLITDYALPFTPEW